MDALTEGDEILERTPGLAYRKTLYMNECEIAEMTERIRAGDRRARAPEGETR